MNYSSLPESSPSFLLVTTVGVKPVADRRRKRRENSASRRRSLFHSRCCLSGFADGGFGLTQFRPEEKNRNNSAVLMARNREKEDVINRISVSAAYDSSSSLGLLQLISVLIIFVLGVVIGLVSSSHIDRYFLYKGEDLAYIETLQFSHKNEDDDFSLESFLRHRNLSHRMTDDELFWRASLVPQKMEFPFKRVPKVAFMFLTRGPLPLLPLWERFFAGQDTEMYSVYVHALPGYVFNLSTSSVFSQRQIPSQHVEWGSISLVDAEKRLLANALLDFSNERFVLVSESCIPIYDFKTVYRYLVGSKQSFIQSYDDPSRQGRGRYSSWMKPYVRLSEWRKGSEWFEMHRDLAVRIVSETKYYSVFRRYCKPSCYPDEHYIPTYVAKFYGILNANRSVTYVDWSLMGPHPATFTAANVTRGFIESLRSNATRRCSYNAGTTPVCFLFARKFDSGALQPLLDVASGTMGF
ncbi:hypothetical protein M569_01216 [Genlisea aurea]|uniref:Core-2/I-branching beta-1,6-N-acetylglucosaminyltransferase family protein n=1 Tax=Genlisea aurea TaxID=192259 RepID=S8D2B7_9LAMI|nr:hypothetical protein M569_01216 [Genlisea aurea]